MISFCSIFARVIKPVNNDCQNLFNFKTIKGEEQWGILNESLKFISFIYIYILHCYICRPRFLQVLPQNRLVFFFLEFFLLCIVTKSVNFVCFIYFSATRRTHWQKVHRELIFDLMKQKDWTLILKTWFVQAWKRPLISKLALKRPWNDYSQVL